MPILAQLPIPGGEEETSTGGSESSPPPVVDAPDLGERWSQITEFWRGIEWENLGRNLWEHVQTPAFWIDSGAVVLCVVVAALIARVLRKRALLKDWYPIEQLRRTLGDAGKFPIFLVTFALLLWLTVLIAGLLGYTCPVLRFVTIIYTAYLAVHLPSLLAPGRFWVKPFAFLVIGAAVLHMLGLLDMAVDLLESWGLRIGGVRLTLLSLILGPAVFLLTYGVGKLITGAINRRLVRSPNVPPTVRVLTGKVLQFIMLVLAVGITLSAIGINLTALTVFGGALGLGVGFGLQKVVSNLISGVIILLDRSIKPGDVIEIGDTYGRINGLQTRYVSVITRDKKEFLIPNEDFITQPVINWSFSDKLVRLRVPIGVAYDCDVREAIRLAEEAACQHERVRDDPAPRCLMRGFGDSAINLELRFWITDPGEGCGNITSAVLLSLWDAYQEHDIEIPYPQAELRWRRGGDSGEVVRDRVTPERPDPD